MCAALLAASIGEDEVVAELLNRVAFLDVQDMEVSMLTAWVAAVVEESVSFGACVLHFWQPPWVRMMLWQRY